MGDVPSGLIAHGEDELLVNGIHIEAQIGFSKHEQNILQPLEVDLAFYYRAKTPVEDNLSPMLDYKQIKDDLRRDLLGKRFKLIEAFAEEVARRVLRYTFQGRVTVTVHKPGALTGARDVAVRLTRSVA